MIGNTRWVNKHTGIADLTIKQGKKQKPKNVAAKNREKEVCLNCTKAECRGCGKKKFKNEKMKGEQK